ncbi:MAG: nucleotidyltransferase family protein [Firmicutes bacterium]|nr:nucleotidyltransferase family protein [Bacillota bacterium]
MIGVILAAGRGTRLKEIGKLMPKALLQVGNKTCLEHIILGMKGAGITKFGVVIGHLGEMIEERFGDGKSLGVEITYLRQDLSQYGTGRAVQLSEELADGGPLMVSYGDIIVDPVNYRAMLELSENGTRTVNSVNWVDDPTHGAAVYLREDGTIKRIIEKPPAGQSTTNWNNAGIYVYQPILFDYLRKIEESQRGEYELTEALRQMVEDGIPVRSHKITGYWRDIGRPEDLEAINALLKKDE